MPAPTKIAPVATDTGGFREAWMSAWYRGAWWLWLLRPIEVVFRTLAALRRGLYRLGLLAVYRAPVPVVVVGNITVGGTGKTPAVIALVQDLQKRGIRVGVVSRGYGARGQTSPHWVEDHSAHTQCGDEPLLIKRRTGCPCVASADRPEAVRTLLAGAALDVVISDDGLQHYALFRDLEIAVLDQQRLIGNGFCLPAGPLREPASRLQTVDHVLYRGGPDEAQALRYEPVCLVNLASGEQCSPESEAVARDIHAVAGIGQPGQFFDALRKLGFKQQQHIFADHHSYGAEDFNRLTDKPIIMTEKDAVKCAGLVGANAWYLKIDALLPDAVTTAVAELAQS